MGTPANVYRGPLSGVGIEAAGGSSPNDLGYLGNNNAEITWEKLGYELGDGQEVQLHGHGKVTIEIAETDSANLALIDTTAEQKLTLTALDGKTYEIDNILVGYSVKRGFGDEPHVITITAQKKTASESAFVTITP
jgi:hypothetical protein